jgi:hypothetical protein
MTHPGHPRFANPQEVSPEAAKRAAAREALPGLRDAVVEAAKRYSMARESLEALPNHAPQNQAGAVAFGSTQAHADLLDAVRALRAAESEAL